MTEIPLKNNSTISRLITKSKLLSGLRCPKRLWLQTNRPELAQLSASSLLNAAAGVELGELARRNYPGGILIEHIEQPDLAVVETSALISRRYPLPVFEAAVVHDGLLIRVDILEPTKKGWRMIEVKSAGSVKDHHLLDCAVQLWVLEGAGITVDQVCLAHVDTGFEYAGDGDYSRLIVEEDITETVRDLLSELPEWLKSHQYILKNAMPVERIGPQCKPDCSFTEFCEEGLPEYPVSILPNGRNLIRELQDAGIEDVRDIPDGMLKNERHITVWKATRSNTPFVAPYLKGELAKLPYPRFYLDFETINFVIPRWAGTHPHQQLPFQWSCHIERQSGELEHREFLEPSGNAPMRAFAESLIEAAEADGPIIVYGTFEDTILKQLIGFCPDLETQIRNIIDRLVNLLPWLREYYYHPAMKGSWSIKAVLPTVAPHMDYSQLEEVQNGMLAQMVYLEIIRESSSLEVKIRKICNLLKYCERDTQAMVEVVRFFR